MDLRDLVGGEDQRGSQPPPPERRDDAHLVAVLDPRAEAGRVVDRLAVHVDVDVPVQLALLVAHEPLEPAVRALELVEQPPTSGASSNVSLMPAIYGCGSAGNAFIITL